jgi:hypothetical protein
MKLITISCTGDDFSHTVEEGYPPEEMEWRIIQAAEEQFPNFKQLFHYDSVGLPAVDLIQNGRCIHQMRFEAEV